MKKITMLFLLFISIFIFKINNLKADSCGGNEWTKIEVSGPLDCKFLKVSGTAKTTTTFGFKCSTETESNYPVTKGPSQIKSIILYSGTPKGEHKEVQKFTGNIKCTYGGDFRTKDVLSSGKYYIEYKVMYPQVTQCVSIGGVPCNPTTTYPSETKTYSFTIAEEKTSAAKNNECTISIPKKNINTRTIEFDYACSGKAKATEYAISSKKDYKDNKMSFTKLKKSTDGKKIIDNLKPDSNYVVVLKYKVDSNEKKITKNFKTLSESETTTKIDGNKAGEEKTADHSVTFASAKTTPSKIYDLDEKKVECKDISDLVTEYWKYIVLLTPVVLILLMTVDFVKAVVASDGDQLKKSANTALKRTIATVILLMLPLILKILLDWFGIPLCIY